jgi:hypothetical protein
MRFVFEKSLSLHRLVSNQENTEEEYQYQGQIKGVIMPIKAEDLILSEGNPAKMFKLYTGFEVDLKETDKLLCDGVEYLVRNVRRLEFRALSHAEAIIYKPNS